MIFLRDPFNEGLLTHYETKVYDFYYQVFGAEPEKCGCKKIDKLNDMYIVSSMYIKKNKDINMNTAKLKRGVLLNSTKFENKYTNANLTDDIAREYLELYPENVHLFEVLPPKVEKTEEKDQKVEKSEEKAVKEPKTDKKAPKGKE